MSQDRIWHNLPMIDVESYVGFTQRIIALEAMITSWDDEAASLRHRLRRLEERQAALDVSRETEPLSENPIYFQTLIDLSQETDLG
jgi:hypothetical protein